MLNTPSEICRWSFLLRRRVISGRDVSRILEMALLVPEPGMRGFIFVLRRPRTRAGPEILLRVALFPRPIKHQS